MTQQTIFDYLASQATRDAGIKTVLDNNSEWKKLCMLQIEEMRRNRPSDFPAEFRFEELTARLASTIGIPGSPKAWGALCNACLKRGLFEKTGRYAPMEKKKSHGRCTALYRML